jgi:hypothetical protein
LTFLVIFWAYNTGFRNRSVVAGILINLTIYKIKTFKTKTNCQWHAWQFKTKKNWYLIKLRLAGSGPNIAGKSGLNDLDLII